MYSKVRNGSPCQLEKSPEVTLPVGLGKKGQEVLKLKKASLFIGGRNTQGHGRRIKGRKCHNHAAENIEGVCGFEMVHSPQVRRQSDLEPRNLKLVYFWPFEKAEEEAEQTKKEKQSKASGGLKCRC